MNRWQLMVAEFHYRFGLPVSEDAPELRGAELREGLIAEEASETIAAIQQGDLVKAVDGLADTIYVCLGAALTWGVDLEPIFAAVHEANMRKVGGRLREDGKLLKPPGWRPPPIAELLRQQAMLARSRGQ